MKTDILIILATGLGGLVLGGLLVRFIQQIKGNSVIASAEEKAKSIIQNAKHKGERIKKEKIFQAKERFIELKGEHEKVILEREKKNHRK